MSTRLGPSDLASALGVSRQQVHKYKVTGKIKQGADGKFDVDEVAVALGKNLKIKKGGSPRGRDAKPEAARPVDPTVEYTADGTPEAPATPESITEAQRRDLVAAADLKELKRDQLRGELLRAEDVEQAWGAMVSATRSALLLLPAKLSPRVAVVSDVRECQAIIDKEVRALLSGLSEYRPNE